MHAEAIILAGGLGTRLRSAVPDLPKAMAPVAERPFLHYILSELVRQGVRRVVLAVGYRREAIIEHFGTRFDGMAVDYAVEESLLGTGGAIRQAMNATVGPEVLIMNGDTWLDFDAATMQSRHVAEQAMLTVAAVHVEDVRRYGSLVIEGERVSAFAEKGGHGPGWINGGVYLLSRTLLPAMTEPAPFSFEADFLAPRMALVRPLVHRCAGRFIDIGIPGDFERAQRMFATS